MSSSNELNRVITIDGPAASGKSSVSRALADHLGFNWVSTGAFYRALAYVAQVKSVPLDSESELLTLLKSPDWKIVMDSDATRVFVEGVDVSSEIYGETVGSAASSVSQHPLVRKNLLEAQRACRFEGKGLVAEGRDCGTVVFPDADLKIYLTAHSSSRAERRALEQGLQVNETAEAQQKRDLQDSQRSVAPLQVPAGAHVIDTSGMTLPEVIAKAQDLAKKSLFEVSPKTERA